MLREEGQDGESHAVGAVGLEGERSPVIAVGVIAGCACSVDQEDGIVGIGDRGGVVVGDRPAGGQLIVGVAGAVVVAARGAGVAVEILIVYGVDVGGKNVDWSTGRGDVCASREACVAAAADGAYIESVGSGRREGA